jgi:hypothetical protein
MLSPLIVYIFRKKKLENLLHMKQTKYFGVNVVQWRVSFFALEPVVRVVAFVHCLRVEFRHHFVSLRDTGACKLTLLTFHQERETWYLHIERINEYQKFRAFR